MDSNVFRKGDASSCLVVNTTWQEVINKPDFFDELAKRIVAMYSNALDIGPLLKASTLADLKTAINSILVEPLTNPDYNTPDNATTPRANTVLADAFWDEIELPDEMWGKLKDALIGASNMREQTLEHTPLTTKDTLQEVKVNFNETVVYPLLSINDNE